MLWSKCSCHNVGGLRSPPLVEDIRQTDTTALNSPISPETVDVLIHLNVVRGFDLPKIKQEEYLLQKKEFFMEHVLANSQPQF